MDLIDRAPSSEPSRRTFSAMPELSLPPSYPSVQPDAGNGILMRLRRHKLLFTTVFIGVAVLVAGAYLYLPATYKASASLTIAPPDRVLSSQQASDAQSTVGDSSDLESQAVILSSPLLIREMLNRPDVQASLLQECEVAQPPEWKHALRDVLHLQQPIPCQQQMADTTSMVSDIGGRLGVATNGRSRVINVTFTSQVPEVAQIVANGIVKVYLDSRIREKLQPRDEALEWLRAETARVGNRLKTTEGQIEAFLHSKGVVRGQVAPIASEQLTSLSQQLAMAEGDKAATAGRMQQANAQGSATAGVLDNRGVSDVKQQLLTVSAQIAQLSARYGSSNPALTELMEQRRGLERSLGRETSLVTRSATADYQAASSRVATLRQQIDGLKQDVRGNDDATTQVASLQRDAATDRELYLDMTKSLNQLETNRRLVTANARLVSLAELPQGVFFPKLSTFALTGLLLAGALATMTALLRDRADRTVRAVDGLQDAARLQVLARVPHVPRVGRGSTMLEQRIQKPSVFQEAIRSLYAECVLLRTRRESRVRSIMLCSADAGEGKTFITLALAHFAVAAGQRVLVLECDLRRPSIGRSLSLPNRGGIADILRGTATAEDMVCSTASGGLDVIMAGKPSVDSTELLGSPRLQALLDWANARYDLVLIDTPPARALPDARILAPEVDGILFCAQWGRSHTDAVVNSVTELRSAGGRVLGLVLDRVAAEQYRLYDASSQPKSYLIANRG